MAEPLLAVDGLSVVLPAAGGPRPVVRRVSFRVGRGEIVGLVGESGAGKTMTALALMRLTPPEALLSGRVMLGGEDLIALPGRRLRRLRGARVAMIFQEPMTALDPVYTIGFQIAEALRAHRRLGRRQARQEAARLLDRVAVADAARRLDDYPHQLSGGQRQRVMIAMALASGPDLLLADEPTSALDVTVQAQILDLLEDLRRDLGLAVLLVTHDLGIVAGSCDRVLVLYAGQVVEEAPVEDLFARPAHPYTRGLLAALPRLGRPIPRGRLPTLPGKVPVPGALPPGCPFHPRCGEAMPICRRRRPALAALDGRRTVRCFLHSDAEDVA